MTDVKRELLLILEEMHPEVDFAEADELVDDGILDSFDMVELVTEIDDRFDVELSASELVPEHFNSVDAMTALVERYWEKG